MMDTEKARASVWDYLTKPRPEILFILMGIGLLLEIHFHFYHQHSAAYLHFFYLFIVLAGIWYPKKAIWIALFFSLLYLFIELLPPSSLSPDSLFRVIMLCLIALVVGSISGRMRYFQEGLNLNQSELEQSRTALELGNKKLNMLSSITRHDILNQVMILRNYLDLSREMEMDSSAREYLNKADSAAQAIEHQITFTRYYQDMGLSTPEWQNVEDYIRSAATLLRIVDVSVDVSFEGLEIYADHLVRNVFYNLMENSLRHGGEVTRLSFSFEETGEGGVLTYTDDGAGISDEDRSRLFQRGFGKNTGLGLFLSREILSITDLTIRENGEQGKGVRFEITIPADKYRITGRDIS